MANIAGVPFKLTAEDLGAFDATKAFQGGQNVISTMIAQELNNLEAQRRRATLPAAGRTAMAEAISKEMANKIQAPRADRANEFAQAELAYNQGKPQQQSAETNYLNQQSKYYGQNMQSQISSRIEDTLAQRIKNKFLPESERSRIDAEQARMKYMEQGGGKLGTGGQEEFFFQNLVAKDNPQLQGDPNKIYEASNALRQGRNQLSDGTPLNPLSPASRSSFDRLTKGATTSGALTPLINASQADEEINVLSKYAQEGLKPYGNTILNKSPEQIMDTFKNDETSQKRLGKFIAAQQLQYEIAQNEIKLAMGQPGVTSTQELMHLGGQSVDAKFPKLSYTARQEANRYFLEALKKGLQARKLAGVSPSKALAIENKEENSSSPENFSDEDIQHTAYQYGISPEEVRKRLGK